ncbi:MAG: phosphatidylglycerophosphatase A [Planctomycetes bacterium]|jgi:phosphatidylglycerophosphatase A|nr:phosphatidylglycerophosphatase A [Planctomycetota bacterium]
MNWKRWIATCFGLGWLPKAPGSWGSLPPAVVFYLMMWCCAPGLGTSAAMLVMLVAGCAACILFAPASIAATGKDDPGEVVMDEFAAQALTFLAIPLVVARNLSGVESLVLAVFGFLVFRIFDILKPWPIRRLERLPAGWGILADDLVAGLGAAVFAYVAMRILVR